MTTKKISRNDFLNFVMAKANLVKYTQTAFTGKNIYFLCSEYWNGTRTELEEDIQIEFIPQSTRYFFTILVRGLKKETDYLHDDMVEYLRCLNLGRNIILDTESRSSLV